MSARGYLEGTQLNPREIASLAYKTGPKWRNPLVLVVAVAVSLCESQGYTKARCENVDDATGRIKSVDHGPWQINEKELNPKLFDPKYNAQRAYMLYDSRGWQPWVGFNHDIYLRDTYMGRAALGVMNFLVEQMNKEGSTLPIPLFSNSDLSEKIRPKHLFGSKAKSAIELFMKPKWEVLEIKKELDNG